MTDATGLSQEQRDKLEQLKADARKVMATPEGRRLLWWVVDGLAGFSKGTFVAGEFPHISSYQQGRREVGVELLARLQDWAPEQWALRMQEDAAEFVLQQRKKSLTTTNRGQDE